MELSKNQKQFVEDAEDQGHEIDYEYSGRGMFGAKCPSITVKGMGELNTSAEISWDNMGKDYVIYAPR